MLASRCRFLSGIDRDCDGAAPVVAPIVCQHDARAPGAEGEDAQVCSELVTRDRGVFQPQFSMVPAAMSALTMVSAAILSDNDGAVWILVVSAIPMTLVVVTERF